MSEQQYKFHPTAGIFNLLEDEELQELVQSIRDNGLLHPIKIHDGQIIDGRNRATACMMAGVKPRYEDANVQGSLADYVFAANYHRRQLTDGARQLAAGRYKEETAKEAKERQREQAKRNQPQASSQKVATLPPIEKQKARDVAGEKFNVSGKTVDAAAKVLKQGSKEVVKAVESGKMKVSTAARLVEAPKAVQSAAVKGGQTAVRQAIAEHTPSPSEEARNDAGVKWHKAMYEIRGRLSATREAGGIKELTKRWTDAQRKQYVQDLKEFVEEFEQWIRVLSET
jgi:hypothetical protein